MKIGVLALQGDCPEHEIAIERAARKLNLDVSTARVKSKADLSDISGIVLPGGESTTIGRLLKRTGLLEPLREELERGLPALGTCSGAVLLASEVRDRVVREVSQPILRVMSIEVLRNAFGRQRESFEATVEVEGVGQIRGAFIRAPVIVRVWGAARPLARIEHPLTGSVIAVAIENNMIASIFHPEVTGEIGLHALLLDLARGRL
uniref:Pyridoxal 5'-phosphate synthase subunit PdxT n=1 Tax=Fervidicoccus fontis TaxID=683846 RepID=A0A7J3ZJ69_9CREN